MFLGFIWYAAAAFLQPIAPEPAEHDEFSYLLAGDTFSHGRLTNPSPPQPQFIEAPHILVSPTYASKYPPAQGFWLAIGHSFLGSYYKGVLLQGATLITVLALALTAWSSIWTSVSITTIFGISILPPHYWFSSYWGGGASALACAAVVAGVGQVAFQKRNSSGIIAGFGIVNLMLSRPFEGLLTCAVFFLLTYRCFSDLRLARGKHLNSIIFWLACPIGLGLVFLAIYNKCITGNALLMPYVLHDRLYSVAPVLWALPLKTTLPIYNNERLAAQHGVDGWEVNSYLQMRPPLGPVAASLRVLLQFGRLLGPLLIVLVLLPFIFWDYKIRILFTTTLAGLIILSLETWQFQHYQGPVLVFGVTLAACIAQSMVVRVQSLGCKRYVVSGSVMLAGILTWTCWHRVSSGSPENLAFTDQRRQIQEKLYNRGGKHLVFVHYEDPRRDRRHEWVYNGADLFEAPVLFCNDLGFAKNSGFIATLPDRQPWYLQVTAEKVILSLYLVGDTK